MTLKLSVVVLTFLAAAFAQSSATLSGRIRDASGAMVPNASVSSGIL